VRANNLPTFAQTVPFNNIQGTTLNPPKNRTVPPPNQPNSTGCACYGRARPGCTEEETARPLKHKPLRLAAD
jgi:hypothetical protein